MKRILFLSALVALCFVAARAEPFLAAPEWSVEQQAIVSSVNSATPDAAVVPSRAGMRVQGNADPAAQAPARPVPTTMISSLRLFEGLTRF